MSSSTGRGRSPFASSLFMNRRGKMRTLALTKQYAWADFDPAYRTILNDWLWGTAVVGEVKAYTSSGWAPKPLKVWNGSAWVIKPLKVWNGSAWIETTY